MKRLFAVLLLLLICSSAWGQPDARPGPYALTLAKWKAILTGTKTASYIVDGSGAARLLTAADIPAHNASAANLTSGAIASAARLSTSGTADSSTFLRGDLTWATPAGGSSNISLSNITSGTLASSVPLNMGPNAIVFNGAATGDFAKTQIVSDADAGNLFVITPAAKYLDFYCGSTQVGRMGASWLHGGIGTAKNYIYSASDSNYIVYNSGTGYGHGFSVGGTLMMYVDGTKSGLMLPVSATPASASASGITGQICWDSSYWYVCTGTNTWKRAALSTW